VLKSRAIGLVLRLAIIVAVLSSVLVFSVQPAAAASSIAQSRFPAPNNYILNNGSGVEQFWWKVTFTDTLPVFMTHEIYIGEEYNAANVVHLHAWTFPGVSNIPANASSTAFVLPGNPSMTSPIDAQTDYAVNIYNIENTGNDAAQEANFIAANPVDNFAHKATIPPGVPPGLYTSRVNFWSSAVGAGNVASAAQLTSIDSRAEVTFQVAEVMRIFKYHDLNLSATWNGTHLPVTGEPGLDGWEFTVVGPANAFGAGVNTFSGNTSGGGFLDLPPILVTGNYTITEVLKPGWVNTDPPGAAPVQKTVNVPDDVGPPDFEVRFGNFQLQPGTDVDIDADSAGLPLGHEGGPIDLMVSETNSGDVDLDTISVDVTSDLVAPYAAFTLTKAGGGPAGTTFDGLDTGNDDVMSPGETWSWTIPNVPIPANAGPGTAFYTFVATGHGLDASGKDITFDEFALERASLTIPVPPPVLVPGLSSLGLGLLIAALGGLMGLFLYRRARQAKLHS